MQENVEKKPAGFLYPVIDPNRCEGKGPCIEVCPVDVFVMGELTSEQRRTLSFKGKIKGLMHQWKQAVVTQAEACQACGLCVSACPEKAITLAKAR
jgi:4Fe-4S ferredoxin